MMDNQTGDPDESKNIVKVQLPPFWSYEPELWFLQVEAQFKIFQIKSSHAKANHIVAALSQETLKAVSDLLPTNDYETLKTSILQRCSLSNSEKIRKLLTNQGHDEKRPSQLLRDLKTLAGNNVADEILKEIWMQRLPSHIQTVLQVSSENLDKLGILADNIASIVQPEILATSSRDEIEVLRNEVQILKNELKQLNMQQKPRLNSPRNKPSSTSPTSNCCWYHQKFGHRARRCQPPCSYQEN